MSPPEFGRRTGVGAHTVNTVFHDELLAIDRYLDRVCRRTASCEQVGPFDLFVEPVPFSPKYGRPSVGATMEFDAAAVSALLARQRELRLPLELEFIAELQPALADLLESLSWTVRRLPLLVLHGTPTPRVGADDLILRFVDTDDPDLSIIDSIGHVAFGSPGMGVGIEGVAELTLLAASHDPSNVRARLVRGDATMVAAIVDGDPVAVGMHIGDVETSTTEIVSIGTLPAFRRRGLAGAVTSVLASDARERGIARVWLSASDDDVANMYAHIGFRRVGTFVLASLASGELLTD
jgi:ribosomal protein S18 acetylase RimI-like enzyme